MLTISSFCFSFFDNDLKIRMFSKVIFRLKTKLKIRISTLAIDSLESSMSSDGNSSIALSGRLKKP